MLHAPDFLGYPSVVQMAKDYADVVQRGLQMKKTGNAIIEFLGGRAVHPVNVRVGGFYKVPTKQEFGPLVEKLKWGREAALETVRWTAQLPFPDFEQDYEFVALSHAEEYPFNEGRLVSSRGLNITAREYDDHFIEEHVPYSNALHSRIKERGAGPTSQGRWRVTP
jgi:sulfhydrogenase subunit alpha